MKDWKRYSVANLISDGVLFVGDGYRARNEELANHGIPFARVSNIKDGFQLENADQFPEKDLYKVGNKISQYGDVVLTSKGTVGRFAYVRADIPKFVYSPQLCFWRVLDSEIIDSRFLFFWMSSWEFLLQINGVKGQTDMADYVSLADQRVMHLTLPSLPAQRAIAGILGALDDKIELNRRMNITLESIARAVFRQWFVENEKVNGWESLKWGDISTLEYGKSLCDYKFTVAPYVVYGTNGAIGRHTEFLYPSEGIIIGRKGAYRGIHYSPNPFFVIDTAFYLKPRKPFSMKWAYYELLRVDLDGMDSGSAIPSTSRTDFYNLPVVFPPQEIMNSFDAFVAPLFSKIYANETESRTLASLRDTLLPKLMRGEVRVSEL